MAVTETTDQRPDPRPATPDPGGTRLAIWLGVVGLLIVLNYVGRYAVEAPADEDSRDVLYEWSTFAGALIQFGFLALVTLLLTVGASARELLALRRPRSWPVALGLAFAVFIGTYVVAGIVGALGADPGEEQGLTPKGWDPDRAVPFLANAVLVVGFVPMVEELMFRGLGFSLLSRWGAAAAIVGSAALFALGHGVLAGLPIFLFLGLGLAWIRHRSGSVYPGIVLHATFNAIALIASVTLGGDS
ncbi:MAG TPA: type II CAAX endopeptidase family protein [Gaiellaceae bacterium]|nr:type II CAAX endopeptidase family protein [Gaiellaceae bacterium]